MKSEYTLLRPGKQCKFWRYRLASDATRTARSTKCRLKHEAKEYVEKIINQKKQLNHEKLIFKIYSNKFFDDEKTCPYILAKKKENYKWSKSWVKARKGHLHNYLLPQFGNYELKEIDYSIVDPWIDSLGLSLKVRNEIIGSLQIIIDYAIKDMKIPNEPKYKFTTYKNIESQPRESLILTEIKSLFPNDEKYLNKIWESRNNLLTLSYLMATTGLRTGEARALRWSDINFDKNGIIVCHTISNDDQLEPTKTNKTKKLNSPDRAVPLSERTKKMLINLKKDCNNPKENDFIFTGKNTQKPISRKTLNKQFRKIVKKQFPDKVITPYSFRHSYKQNFSFLMGENVVESLLGHSQGKISDHYNRPSQQMMIQRLDQIEQCRKIINNELG